MLSFKIAFGLINFYILQGVALTASLTAACELGVRRGLTRKEGEGMVLNGQCLLKSPCGVGKQPAAP